jgi:Holliday junction resolvasome RuvABC endonuclease subunit
MYELVANSILLYMKLMALDVAFRITGYCIFNENRSIDTFSTINFPKKYKLTDANLLYNLYVKLYEDSFSNEDRKVLAVEDILMGGHYKAALSIHAGRTLAVAAFKNCFPDGEIYFASPSDVKYYFAGKRGAKKEVMKPAVIEKVSDTYGTSVIETMDEDELDAFALGLFIYDKYLTA